MTVYVLCMPEKNAKPKSQYWILSNTYETQIAKILSLSAPAAAKVSAPAAPSMLYIFHEWNVKFYIGLLMLYGKFT